MKRTHGWRFPVLSIAALMLGGCAAGFPGKPAGQAIPAVSADVQEPSTENGSEDASFSPGAISDLRPGSFSVSIPEREAVPECPDTFPFSDDLQLDGAEADFGFSGDSPVERALEVARSLLGAPYSPGGNDPDGFDCSGLVQYVYRQIGINLPRSSREQFGKVSLISLEELQPGDLLFFKISRRRISHVGIYVDADRFIHAPSRGKGVSYAKFTEPYWRKRLVGAGRLELPEDSGS